MPEIKKAFHKFSTPQKAYTPKLTIVICGKRHHTRFYPTDAQNADQLGNPRPGTVVDRGVTAVYDFDFFLQAHGGTSRPPLLLRRASADGGDGLQVCRARRARRTTTCCTTRTSSARTSYRR